jgi:signal transduction histidine kinase
MKGFSRQSTQHLVGIVNDILDIARIEAERLTLDRVVLNLGEALENPTTLTEVNTV